MGEGRIGLAVEAGLVVSSDRQMGGVDGQSAVRGGEVIVGGGQTGSAGGNGIATNPARRRRRAAPRGAAGQAGTGGVLTIDVAGDGFSERWIGLAVKAGLVASGNGQMRRINGQGAVRGGEVIVGGG